MKNYNDLNNIVASQSRSFRVDKDGKLGEVVAATEPRYSCTKHGLAFADWSSAQEHITQVNEIVSAL